MFNTFIPGKVTAAIKRAKIDSYSSCNAI